MQVTLTPCHLKDAHVGDVPSKSGRRRHFCVNCVPPHSVLVLFLGMGTFSFFSARFCPFGCLGAREERRKTTQMPHGLRKAADPLSADAGFSMMDLRQGGSLAGWRVHAGAV